MDTLPKGILWEIFNRFDDWDFHRLIAKNIVNEDNSGTFLKYMLRRQRWQWTMFDIDKGYDEALSSNLGIELDNPMAIHYYISKLMHTLVYHEGIFEICQHTNRGEISMVVEGCTGLPKIYCMACIRNSACEQCGAWSCWCDNVS